jgi:ribosomal protein S18 acetylase RimI-like enzyme
MRFFEDATSRRRRHRRFDQRRACTTFVRGACKPNAPAGSDSPTGPAAPGKKRVRPSHGGTWRPVPWHDAWVLIVIRQAEMRDQDALTRIEQETWSLDVSPNVYIPRPFFENARPEEVLVGVLDGEVAGFLCLRPATPLPSNAHVLMIAGLGVTPSMQRKGVASALLEAAETYASEHKIERMTLRVLAVNTAARALYERSGYQTEGELRGEFRLPLGPAGAVVLVDDVLMAKTIKPVPQPPSGAAVFSQLS